MCLLNLVFSETAISIERFHDHDLLQGVVTPIGPVLTTATAVKLWSSGQGSFKKTVKRLRQVQAANRSTVKAHKDELIIIIIIKL